MGTGAARGAAVSSWTLTLDKGRESTTGESRDSGKGGSLPAPRPVSLACVAGEAGLAALSAIAPALSWSNAARACDGTNDAAADGLGNSTRGGLRGLSLISGPRDCTFESLALEISSRPCPWMCLSFQRPRRGGAISSSRLISSRLGGGGAKSDTHCVEALGRLPLARPPHPPHEVVGDTIWLRRGPPRGAATGGARHPSIARAFAGLPCGPDVHQLLEPPKWGFHWVGGPWKCRWGPVAITPHEAQRAPPLLGRPFFIARPHLRSVTQ